MTITELLDKLDRVTTNGAGWKARCPAHEDKNPSLSVTEREGKILLHCHAGCAPEAIVAALGCTMHDLSMNNSNGVAGAAPSAKPQAARFQGTERTVEEMQIAFVGNTEVQTYVERRGISLRVAADLKWGFAGAWNFAAGPKPALMIPHYVDGRLVGIKARTISGAKEFSQQKGSSAHGLYAAQALDAQAEDVIVVEGPEDAALLISHGFNATAINSAGATLADGDLGRLRVYKRIFLVGDQDRPGQQAMLALEGRLPPEQAIRVRIRGHKDVGELYSKDRNGFREAVSAALRIAEITRTNFSWQDLETEAELAAGGTGVLPCLVDGVIPADDVTMFAGREGSYKTLLAIYLAKAVANGAPVFGCFRTIRKPVLYLDAENHAGTHQVYLPFFAGVGPEQIRFRTLRYGVPALTDPALIRICEEMRPFLVIDSLIRFCGRRDRDSSEMTETMEQIARLATCGATVLLIHHTRRSDEEEYANSFAIGATVGWWYAIVKDDTGLVKRVQMLHKKARGGTEVNRNLIAFPDILDRGMFTLDGEVPRTDGELLLDFVRSRNGSCNFNAIKNELKGLGVRRKKLALDGAIESGELVKSRSGREVIFSLEKIGSGVGNSSIKDLIGSGVGTSGNRSDGTD